MKFWRSLVAAYFASLIAATGLAQTSTTRSVLQTQNNSTIAPNGVGAVTGSVLNAMIGNIIASMATLQDFDAFANPPIYASSGILFASATNPSLFVNCTGALIANGSSAPTCIASTGVTCSGSPTSSFASVGGIVTHC